MPERPPTRAPRTAGEQIDVEVLTRAAAEAIAAVPGVLRIEPTLTGAVRSLISSDQSDDPLVELSARGRLVDVSVSVATRDDHPARSVAHDVRAVLLQVVSAVDAEVGDLAVNVLTVEPAIDVAAT